MNHYIIDGNNLIGRIKTLKQLQKKDKQASREKLVNLLNKYFKGKKLKLTLHLDGHANLPLPLFKGKIEYSNRDTSDNLIRREIEFSSSPRLIILISSDHSLMNFGKVCGCTVISSDDFNRTIENSFDKNEEEEKIKELNNEQSEFLRLFEDREEK